MKKVLIMIPSYKRAPVLEFTLKHLCLNIEHGKYDVEIVVGLNKASRVERDIVIEQRKLSETRDLVINYIEFEHNVGKAECLNTIVGRHFRGHDFVLNIDNDMWIKEPWLDMLTYLESIDYDMVGFGSTHFWSHTPGIDANYDELSKYRLYKRPHIAGGMSLYSPAFIETYKFFGHDRVYGGVDGHSCTQAVKKYVLYADTPWLEHDPLGGSTEDLRHYAERKSLLLSKQEIFFKEGWDE